MGVIRRLALRGLRAGLAVFAATVVLAVAASAYVRATAMGPGALEAPVDAAIVLGSRVADDGHLALGSHRRTEGGMALLAAGRAGAVIFSGGTAPGRAMSAGEAMRRYAVAHGADPAALLVEPVSVSTFENLRFSFPIARERGFESLALVSDPYHLPRAWALAAYFGRPDVALVAVRGFEADWWPHRLVTFAREALAWWYNLGKVAAWEALAALGHPPETRAEWVR